MSIDESSPHLLCHHSLLITEHFRQTEWAAQQNIIHSLVPTPRLSGSRLCGRCLPLAPPFLLTNDAR